jgi:hypothetical protein
MTVKGSGESLKDPQLACIVHGTYKVTDFSQYVGCCDHSRESGGQSPQRDDLLHVEVSQLVVLTCADECRIDSGYQIEKQKVGIKKQSS